MNSASSPRSTRPQNSNPTPLSQKRLFALQRDTFRYFLDEVNPENGLIPDSTRADSPSSIAACGLALACYPVGVERGYLSRSQAAQSTLAMLRFFQDSEQSAEPDATGYKGFYYHFLDMKSGRRAWKCELSTMDSALLLAGVLCAAQYFDLDNSAERELRERAELLYRRADWRWAQNLDEAAPGCEAIHHGWKPELPKKRDGFLRARWQGYNEALILYALGLGSPTHPLSRESYASWLSTYRWKKIYDLEHLYCGPLFTHQFSHAWIDFRGIQDEYMRAKETDYFENSRRATYLQQEYSRRNPRGFKGYHEWCWGLTAVDGPSRKKRTIDGRVVHFHKYQARGAPFGPDDGTIAPWAALASLPFAPEIVLPTIGYIVEQYPDMIGQYGFRCGFNPTYGMNDKGGNWIGQHQFGIDQGPVVLMIENHRSGLIWQLMRECPFLINGLRRAGFEGGWLVDAEV